MKNTPKIIVGSEIKYYNGWIEKHVSYKEKTHLKAWYGWYFSI